MGLGLDGLDGDPPVIREARDAVDHLLIGAASLDEGIAWLEARTGVRATPGGSHPGLGTWNALASLGARQYMEIIAPDPGQPGVESFYFPGLRGFKEPRLVTWAASANDRLTPRSNAQPSPFRYEPARDGARVRPDGTLLAWSLEFPRHNEHETFSGALPFFIKWTSTEAHPGGTTPAGLTLRALSFSHPRSEALREALLALGLDATIHGAAGPTIHAELETPRGLVRL